MQMQSRRDCKRDARLDALLDLLYADIGRYEDQVPGPARVLRTFALFDTPWSLNLYGCHTLAGRRCSFAYL